MEFNQILPYTKDLEKYLKTKIKTDQWQDIYQDTICYLLIQSNKQIGKGFVITAAKFFISKWHQREKKWQTGLNNIDTIYNQTLIFDTSTGFNGFEIDDKMLNKINKVKIEDWRLIQLQLEFGLKLEQISEMTGQSVGCIKSKLKRIKNQLC